MDAPSSNDDVNRNNSVLHTTEASSTDPAVRIAKFAERTMASFSELANMTTQTQTREDPPAVKSQSAASEPTSPVVEPSRTREVPSTSTAPDSIAGLILEASKNTVLGWWNQDEEVECIACGDRKANILVDDDLALDDNSTGILDHQSQDGASSVEVNDSSTTTSCKSAAVAAQLVDSATSLATERRIRMGFALEQKLQEMKGQADSAGTASSSSSTQCSSDNSSDGDGSRPRSNHCRGRSDQSLTERWANFVKRIGDAIAVVLTAIAMIAARNPYLCIMYTIITAFVLVGTGCYFNFTLVVDNFLLWPPGHSFSVIQQNWLYEVSDFHWEYRYLDMIVHADGDNVLSQDGVTRVFSAMNVIQNTTEYQEGCSWAELVGDAERVGECHIHSVSQFWNNSYSIFDEDVQFDTGVSTALANARFPTGQAVDMTRIVGNAEYNDNGTAVYAESFLIEFDLPWSYETAEFEWEALLLLEALQEEWSSEEGNIFRLEIVAYRSYEDEFLRAIVSDLPLLPAVFAVMCLFCCLVFFRRDRVHSRCLLGMGAVVTILLSIMASFGLMFLCGVPFTTSTSMLPFLMFGIGLDDSFIIIGSYSRTHGHDVLKRIEMTMQDISLSIFITTLTSTLAFTLGCFSDIPAVRWLCIYAAPSVVIDFFLQITFFISLVVLDERRIEEGRMDCCTFVHVNNGNQGEAEEDLEKVPGSERTSPKVDSLPEKHWADRFMGWYADKLLQPTVQKCVLVGFFGLLAGSIYATTTLSQYFDLNDMVPHDSYMRGYYASLKDFASEKNGLPSHAYFRDIDQSNAAIQQQMIDFVDDLAAKDAVSAIPANFWLRDFLDFVDETGLSSQAHVTFSEQVDAFLKVPLYNDIYDDHIVRDSRTGDILSSRCELYINIDLADAAGGIDALALLREVSSTQPINEGLDGGDWKFFTYQDMYNLWEFYSTVVEELRLSTIIGIVSVSLVGFLLIPHWSAVFFITPMIASLYTGMLAYISYTNIHVNAISYVQVIMSIGLMVDYLVHILMRFYECEGSRRERVKHTLETMGASVFVGGLSSLLGVCLLAFSSSEILNMVFVAVIGLVTLGVLHGLVFLPVILSLIGPESPTATSVRLVAVSQKHPDYAMPEGTASF